MSGTDLYESGLEKYYNKEYKEAFDLFLEGEKLQNEDCMYMLSKM